MKSFLNAVFLIAAVLAIGGVANVHAATITDDFSDLNDTANPVWTHLSGLVGSTGQTWNADSSSAPATNPPASGGEYRLVAPANGAVINGVRFGFVGSYTGASYTDVNVMVDFVEPFQAAQYGVAARLNGNNGGGALAGYAYVYEPDAGPETFPGSGIRTGEMVLIKLAGADPQDIGSQPVLGGPLDFVNENYNFSLSVIGSNTTGGNTLHGVLTRVSDGMVLADRTVNNVSSNVYNQGFSGMFGYNGKAATDTDPTHGVTDFTADNFKAQDVPEPAAMLLVACGAGLILLSGRFRRGN